MRNKSQNQSVICMLAKMYSKENQGRNRILKLAVCLCIFTLAIIFGISYGKTRAEYLKEVRKEGTTSSATIENASFNQYKTVQKFSYIKEVGETKEAGSCRRIRRNM